MSSFMSPRSLTRVAEPPGGKSTISFGSDYGPLSPKPKPTAPEVVVVPEAVPEPEAEPIEEGPALDILKLQAITAIASAKDDAGVRAALTTLVKELQVATSAAAETRAHEEAATAAAPATEDNTPPAADSSIAALKATLKLRGTHGIITIGKKFRSIDDSGDRKIAYDEFKKAMLEMKLGLTEADMTKLFRHFDSDASGFITFDELLLGLRGELTERRMDMVRRCFKVLDKNGDGNVTLADMENRYDASRHPDVIAGTKTSRMVLLEFLGTFEQAGGGTKGDGRVDFEEFKNYYAMISANIDEGPSGDDYFELMMRNVWHVSGGEGWAANTTCKRVLVVFEDDTQKVMELTDDFDTDVKSVPAVKAKLVEQGVTNIRSVALYGDMNESSAPPASLAPSPEPLRAAGRRSANPANRSSIVFG